MNSEQKVQAKISNLVYETFSSIRTVISFAAQKQTIYKYCFVNYFIHFILQIKLFRYERLSNAYNKMMEERLRASSVYDSLAQILFTELIFTAALCYGMWRVGDNQPGRLGAVITFT